jgi:hypothetical protein
MLAAKFAGKRNHLRIGIPACPVLLASKSAGGRNASTATVTNLAGRCLELHG